MKSLKEGRNQAMQSSLLTENGLINCIGGSGFNFRYQRAGDKVVQDVQKVLETVDAHPKEIYSGQQVHSANVKYVDGENGEDFVFGRTFKETDGLITDRPGVALFIKFADCTPIVLFDPIKKVQASVHSGWRGTVQQISVEAIKQMVNNFGCKKENILAYVGPSIDQENYEVGSEVYEAFSSFEDRDNFFKAHGEKYLMSMLDANLSILRSAGIKENNIDVERASTFTDERLHSARKEGADYQLNAIMTMMEQ